MAKSETHYFVGCSQGGEFTLCGMAFDAFESGDSDEKIVSAAPGGPITCAQCQAIIAEVKAIQNNRVPAQRHGRGDGVK